MLTVSLFEVIIMVGTSYRNHGSAHTLLFVSQFSVEAEENLKATEFLRTWFGFFFFFFCNSPHLWYAAQRPTLETFFMSLEGEVKSVCGPVYTLCLCVPPENGR